MFTNFRKSSNQNIFKTDKSKDSECVLLNKYCLQKCYCERNVDKNISKYFIDKDIFNWELEVYSKLISKRVVPKITVNDGASLTYNVSDKISMYNYLLKNKDYTKVILNELYSFVKKFNRYNFLHGNLHLHNIFINPDEFSSKGRLYVVDFSNSYLFQTNRKGVTSCPCYKRTSFIGEYDKKVNDEFFIYWDFFTLYVSLKMFFKNDLEHLVYLENLVQNYMSEEMIKKFISYIS
jgi:hypothetical protein